MTKGVTKTINYLSGHVIDRPVKIGLNITDMHNSVLDGAVIKGTHDIGLNIDNATDSVFTNIVISYEAQEKEKEKELRVAIEALTKSNEINNQLIAEKLSGLYKEENKESKIKKIKEILETIKTLTDLSPLASTAIKAAMAFLASQGIHIN
ncbi:TPA: hypothetical protein ACK1J9_000810 [Enterobacter hormaechei]